MTPRPTLLGQFLPLLLTLFLGTLVVFGSFILVQSQNEHLREVKAELETAAHRLIGELPDLSKTSAAELELWARSSTRSGTLHIALINPKGSLLAASQSGSVQLADQSLRPEVKGALHGSTIFIERFSHEMQKSVLVIALPVYQHGELAGVLRLTRIAPTALGARFGLLWQVIALGLLLTALGTAGVYVLVRRFSTALTEMRDGVDRMARGELDSRLIVPENREVGGVAEAMNQMASILDERIRTVLQQRNEQEAVLAAMIEGVIAVDRDERILNCNQAAADFLGIQPQDVLGRTLQEVVRNRDLHSFAAKALESMSPVEDDLIFLDPEERFIQAHGAPLRDARGAGIGAVIVLNDITRLRRLENLRKDFVANVSHELKTPITSIKGFVETLLDGALADPEDAKRFCEIIGKQVDRLNNIIDDLLALSRIEREAERSELVLSPGSVRKMIEEAVQTCDHKAREKDVALEIHAESSLMIRMNSPLLEQALVNLIDNALKYSEAGKSIHVTAERQNGEVRIHVADEGCGIEAEHLPRLFERFYRVDKARSRKLGGTGLGLAIVKHIAQAHGGRVSVVSTPGKGSTFTIHLPSAVAEVDRSAVA